MNVFQRLTGRGIVSKGGVPLREVRSNARQALALNIPPRNGGMAYTHYAFEKANLDPLIELFDSPAADFSQKFARQRVVRSVYSELGSLAPPVASGTLAALRQKLIPLFENYVAGSHEGQEKVLSAFWTELSAALEDSNPGKVAMIIEEATSALSSWDSRTLLTNQITLSFWPGQVPEELKGPLTDLMDGGSSRRALEMAQRLTSSLQEGLSPTASKINELCSQSIEAFEITTPERRSELHQALERVGEAYGEGGAATMISANLADMKIRLRRDNFGTTLE